MIRLMGTLGGLRIFSGATVSITGQAAAICPCLARSVQGQQKAISPAVGVSHCISSLLQAPLAPDCPSAEGPAHVQVPDPDGIRSPITIVNQ